MHRTARRQGETELSAKESESHKVPRANKSKMKVRGERKGLSSPSTEGQLVQGVKRKAEFGVKKKLGGNRLESRGWALFVVSVPSQIEYESGVGIFVEVKPRACAEGTLHWIAAV